MTDTIDIQPNSSEILETETSDLELTTREKQILDSLQNSDKAGSEATVLFGILGGVVVAAFVNPFVGGCFGLAIAGNSIISGIGRANQRRKVLFGEAPPISLLNKQQLEEYKEEVGEERFAQELQQLDTKDSWGVIDKGIKEEAFNQQIETKSSGVSPVDQLSGYYSQHCLLIGGSGDGKDFWLSNTIRQLLKENPKLKIFVLDAKGLPRERGYYDGLPIKLEREQCGEMGDEDVVAWFKEKFNAFIEATKQDDNQWLFISTEQTLIGEAFARLKDDYLKEVVSKQITTGSGFDRAFWFLGQFPNLANLGMDNSSRGQLKTFAIVKNTNIATACKQWARSGVVGKPKERELRALCKISEVDRCFYSPDTGEWHPMPKLENYSSYDRDRRQVLKPETPTSSASQKETKPPEQATVIQTEQATVIQEPQPVDPRLKQKLELIDALTLYPGGDVYEAIKERNPLIEKDKLEQLVDRLFLLASQHNKSDFIGKFGK